MTAGKHVPSQAQPGCTQDATGAVGAHFQGRGEGPQPVNAARDDMRDGDDDRSATVPQEPQTTVPGSAASEAFRGNGTP